MISFTQNIKKYKKSISNVGYLGVLQLCNILFPIITYPYLINILGSKEYGEVLYYQGISLFLAIFISFGFNLSATRDISKIKFSSKRVNLKASHIIYAKFIFFIPTYFIYCVLGYFVFIKNDHFLLYVLCSGPLISETLVPLWLYQGLEKLKYSSILIVINKMLLLLLIVVFVNDGSDNYIYALVLLVYNLMYSFTSLFFANFKFEFKFKRSSKKRIVESIKRGYSVFLSTFFIAIKDRLNVIIVGYAIGSAEVVVLDLASKLLTVICIPQNIIANAFYASISKSKDKTTIKSLAKVINILNLPIYLISSLSVFFFLEYLVDYTIEQTNVLILYMFAIVPLGVSVSISRLYLLPFKFDKILAKTVFLNCIVYFILMFLYLILFKPSVMGITTVIILTYISEMIIRLLAFKKTCKVTGNENE